MSKSRSCFIHVEKSGGSSIISSLKASLGDANVFHANESRYQRAPLDVLLDQYPVVAGHFTFAQVTADLLRNTFFFTFLRNPIDRALSHYYYYRNQPESLVAGSRVALARELDLEAFVAALSDRPSPWSNWQTFVFSGATDVEQPAADLLPSALWNLERLDFVGIHDEFGEGMRRLFMTRGWPAGVLVPRVNVTEHRLRGDEIPPAVRRRLEQLNESDLELFAHARELWTTPRSSHAEVKEPAPMTSGDVAGRHARSEHGTREIVLTGVELRTAPARPDGVIQVNDRLFLELRGACTVSDDDVTLGIRISDDLGVEVYGVSTHLLGVPVRAREGGTLQTTFALDMTLAPGTYHVTVAIHAGDDHLHKCYHWLDNALSFECRRGEGPAFSGLVDLKANVVVSADEPAPP